MIQAMYNAASGLRAHKTMMDVISNNIANVNTVGYKSGAVSFKEALSQTVSGASAPTATGAGGTNPVQIGLGTAIGSVSVNMTQGSMQSTGQSTDMAVEGHGYFVATDGNAKYYTRDGSFTIDESGNLVTATGNKVLGWMGDPVTGKIDTSAPIDASKTIKLPVSQLVKPTTEVVYGGNLNASTPTGTTKSVVSLMYDSLGQAHNLTVNYTKQQNPIATQGYASAGDSVGSGNLKLSLGTGDTATSYTLAVAPGDTLSDLAAAIGGIKDADGNAVFSAAVLSNGPAGATNYIKVTSADGRQVSMDSSAMSGAGKPAFSATSNEWNWTVSEGGVQFGTGSLTFDSIGKNPVYNGDILLTLQNGATSPQKINLNMGSLTQLSGANSISTASQDGLPLGTLESFTVDGQGTISGVFTNGQTQPLARVALANFSNATGLSNVGNNQFIESANSGPAQISEPGSGGMGKIMGGYLESSNVDLPTEFANMIVAQRGFQANSKIITTSDDILADVVQMKR